MKNKFFYFCLYFLLVVTIPLKISSEEIINFNISEIEITEDGKIIKGYNGGEAYTNDGISILAEEFVYDKNTTLLVADKNVLFKDNKKNIIIKANNISYQKNQENIFANGNVVVEDNSKNIIIFAQQITYSKNKDEIEAIGNVEFKDLNKNIKIKTQKAIYQKKLEKFFTEGKTIANINIGYEFDSNNVTFLKNKMILF